MGKMLCSFCGFIELWKKAKARFTLDRFDINKEKNNTISVRRRESYFKKAVSLDNDKHVHYYL